MERSGSKTFENVGFGAHLATERDERVVIRGHATKRSDVTVKNSLVARFFQLFNFILGVHLICRRYSHLAGLRRVIVCGSNYQQNEDRQEFHFHLQCQLLYRRHLSSVIARLSCDFGNVTTVVYQGAMN